MNAIVGSAYPSHYNMNQAMFYIDVPNSILIFITLKVCSKFYESETVSLHADIY